MSTVRGAARSHLFDQERILVGRADNNDLVLEDGKVSRLHAELRLGPIGWLVRDCGSHNGTYLNGHRLYGERPLQPGDELRMGLTRVSFDSDLPGALLEVPAEAAVDLRGSSPGTGSPDGFACCLVTRRSKRMRELLHKAERLANSAIPILITGESGTGKELLARFIHAHSPRSTRPFVVVNCPALPGTLLESELFGVEKGVATGVEERAGWFETASTGTLLLDEIGDMSQSAQAKVLRALQQQSIERLGSRKSIPIDARFLATTHHDLLADIDDGSFREDLYYRLNGVRLELPPLRERREDIPTLVEHFLSLPGPRVTFSPEAMELLGGYHFPGNVRELERIVEAARLLASDAVVLPEHLQLHDSGPNGNGGAPADTRPETLYARVRDAGGCFDSVIRTPFLSRELSRQEVRGFVSHALERAGGSYKQLARDMDMESEYRALLHFLWNHRLRPDRD